MKFSSANYTDEYEPVNRRVHPYSVAFISVRVWAKGKKVKT